MANAKKSWTAKDYSDEAAEFVACYGKGYCWDEFVYEYCSTFEHSKLKKPNGDLLMTAIHKAEQKAA
jgi:hypothetical protein